MMNHWNANKTSTHWLLALVLVVAPVMTASGQDGDTVENTYQWHSELVDLDEAGQTITLRSRIVSYAEVEDLASLKPGDRIAIIWSGAHGYASAIRGVRIDSGHQWADPFTMPAEFVSTQHDDRYLTFRLSVDQTKIEAIQSLEPGEWITLTSPQQPSSPSQVVMNLRPYVSVSNSGAGS